MNGLEYLQYLCGDESGMGCAEDECGNVWIDTGWVPAIYGESIEAIIGYFLPRMIDMGNCREYCMLKEDADKLREYEIILPKEMEGTVFPRRPYYRMRGHSVTKAEALEMIRRTDNYWRYPDDSVYGTPDYIGGYNFDNWLIDKNHYPQGYGWVHADGTIGANAITQKYPEVHEFIGEWLVKLMAFPYLDLMIAVTDFDEVLQDKNGNYIEEGKDRQAADEAFYRHILTGIHVCGKKIEILKKEDAVVRYKQYADLYEREDVSIYDSEYYQDNKIVQIGEEEMRIMEERNRQKTEEALV